MVRNSLVRKSKHESEIDTELEIVSETKTRTSTARVPPCKGHKSIFSVEIQFRFSFGKVSVDVIRKV